MPFSFVDSNPVLHYTGKLLSGPALAIGQGDSEPQTLSQSLTLRLKTLNSLTHSLFRLKTRTLDYLSRKSKTFQFSLVFTLQSSSVSNFYAYLMPKRKAKRVTKQSNSSHVDDTQCDVATNGAPVENTFIDQEVERQSAAIQAIRDMEIERLLTALHLLKSNMSKEQLQTPVLEFFEKNLPNLTVSRAEIDGRIVVKRKDKDGDLSMNTADGGNTISSFLQHMSMAYPDCSTAMPSIGGFEFSSRTEKTSFIGAENLQIKDFVLEEPSDTHILGIEDSLQTPGVTSQRLSVGMTPKTLRLPKQGEMLLSVHGSPLGVFKENNMDAIHEIEEE
ncbi:hypothetical protein L6452_07964 [Arctium lappa]|uniref:Uncharacterized protein n=1 Tax=Arctium lappa TaxID=4217 RepID=A0ACB9DFZ7_ARCLA|nr:hypothetical protein L6452_07964 [Arctium lappa]